MFEEEEGRSEKGEFFKKGGYFGRAESLLLHEGFFFLSFFVGFF